MQSLFLINMFEILYHKSASCVMKTLSVMKRFVLTNVAFNHTHENKD